jgi:hypothetical protein
MQDLVMLNKFFTVPQSSSDQMYFIHPNWLLTHYAHPLQVICYGTTLNHRVLTPPLFL